MRRRGPIELRHVSRYVLAAGLLLLAPAGRAAEFEILYHERIEGWSAGPDTTAKSSATLATKPAQDSLVSFTAFGREFRVRVEPNEVLLRGLSAELRSELRGVEVLRGELVDRPGSWARLTRNGRELTGVIFDGAELFSIDSSRGLSGVLKWRQPGAVDGPIIYRWRDTAGTLTDELGASLDGAAQQPAASLAAMAAVLSPGRELDLGLVADAEFSASQGANPDAALVSRANILDGIFLYQLGVRVNVGELRVFTQEEDPFAALQPSALLGEVEEHRASTPAQNAQDLTHLFTGKDLAEAPSQTGQVVGIANLATVCDARFGAGVTQGTFGTMADALIMAHEIGHNFGAVHDNEAGPCQSTPPGFLMAATRNGSQEYSACSIETMQPELTTAPCLEIVAPGDVELSTFNAPSDAIVGEDFEVNVVVTNVSTTDAYGFEMTVGGNNVVVNGLFAPPSQGFDCFPASAGRCRRQVLPAGAAATIRVVARLNQAAPGVLSVTVRSLHDSNAANDTVNLAIAVRPTVDLVTVLVPPPALVRLREEFNFLATVRNDGPGVATNAWAHIGISLQTLDFVTLSSDVGTCALNQSQVYVCPFGDLPPGTGRTVSGRVRATDTLSTNIPDRHRSGLITVEGQADQRALDFSRSGKSAVLIVAESVADLRTTVSPSLQFQVGTTAEIVVTVANLGPDAATDVWLEYNAGFPQQGLTGVTVTGNRGPCTIFDPSSVRFDCRIPSLPAGESLVVTIRGTASTVGDFAILSTTQVASYDAVSSNDRLSTGYRVAATPPPPPPTGGGGSTGGGGATSGGGGGGGGGAVDPLWLAFLALVLAGLTCRRLTEAAARSEVRTRPAVASRSATIWLRLPAEVSAPPATFSRLVVRGSVASSISSHVAKGES